MARLTVAQAIVTWRQNNEFEQVGQILNVTSPQPNQTNQPGQPSRRWRVSAWSSTTVRSRS